MMSLSELADHTEKNLREILAAEARALDNEGHYKAASKLRGFINGAASLLLENDELIHALDAILEIEANYCDSCHSCAIIEAQKIASAAKLRAVKQRLGV